jgi:cell division septation protein DedD
LFASVQVGENASGFILNISEGGLCVQTAQEIAQEWPLRLRFQSLQSRDWVEAQGRIVWKDYAQTVAGIEFVDLAAQAQQEVRTWLSFGNSMQELHGDWAADQGRVRAETDTDAVEAARLEQGDFAGALLSDSPRPEDEDSAQYPSQPANATQILSNNLTNTAAGRPTSLIAALAIALCLIFLAVLPGHYANPLRRVGGLFAKKTDAVTNLASPSVLSPVTESPQPTAPPTPPPLPADAGRTSLSPASAPVPAPSAKADGDENLVLQVAAMSEAEHANQLVETLRAKKFPAFVSKRPGERLYKVLVGPYSDAQSFRGVEGTLEKEGIKPIIRRWAP